MWIHMYLFVLLLTYGEHISDSFKSLKLPFSGELLDFISSINTHPLLLLLLFQPLVYHFHIPSTVAHTLSHRLSPRIFLGHGSAQ